jgi:hypothetical protein
VGRVVRVFCCVNKLARALIAVAVLLSRKKKKNKRTDEKQIKASLLFNPSKNKHRKQGLKKIDVRGLAHKRLQRV